MRKTEVYTWRVSAALKAGLEEEARSQRRSVADLLDHIVGRHLSSAGGTRPMPAASGGCTRAPRPSPDGCQGATRGERRSRARSSGTACGVAPVLGRALADTGALLAYLDRSDRWHQTMDFADATLVHLARRESLSTVFTVDHGDFETYRIGGRRRFRIVPERCTGRRV
jgi:hypothetical protein